MSYRYISAVIFLSASIETVDGLNSPASCGEERTIESVLWFAAIELLVGYYVRP
jgi:hypothetical protein